MISDDVAVRNLEESLTDDDRKFLDELAEGLTRRRLASLAVLLLESVKPLGWLGSQMLLLFRPMVSLVFHDPVRWDRVQRLLEHREAIELLLRRLEARY